MVRKMNRDRRGEARPAPEPDSAPARAQRAELRPGERIAKVIARAGLASRREAEAWIAAGRVAVNGAVIASPAVKVNAPDRVSVDGKPLPARERTRLFLYHKPRGLVTTTADPEGRPTIFGALPKDLPRLISVGRLDLTTEGLLLLTNDGGLARVLELPQTGWLRRYRVRAHGGVTQAALDALADGIEVDGIRYGPIEASLDRLQGSNVWLTFAMREGKNREIRNVLGALGLQVNRLIRLSFGPFQLGVLREGGVEEVQSRMLRDQIGERLASLAGADFDAPLTVRLPPPSDQPRPARSAREPAEHDRKGQRDHRGERGPRKRDDKGGRGERGPRESGDKDRHDDRGKRPARSGAPQHRRDGERKPARHADKRNPPPRSGHVWRRHDTPRQGAAGGAPHERPHKAPAERNVLTDRKGRRVVVERAGAASPGPKGRPRGRGHKR